MITTIFNKNRLNLNIEGIIIKYYLTSEATPFGILALNLLFLNVKYRACSYINCM